MREARSHPPSPLGAATASAAFPGWGQIRAGHRRIGSALVAGTALLLAATIAAMATEGVLGLIGWLVDPELLLALLVLNLLVATIRVGATTHAWVIAGGRIVSLGLTVLVLLVAMPHVALGYYGFQTRSTLITLFPGDPEVIPAPVDTGSTTSTSTSSTTTLATTTSESYEPLVTPRTIPTSTTTTTIDLPLDTERFTVLLLGGDAGPGRRGLRTDTMIVASINTLTGDTALFGLPRNMGGFSFSDGTPFPGLSKGLLNEVYQWGWRNPDRFSGVDPGASAVSDVAANLLGIPIDYFMLVDMVGFAELIDVLGGVTVNVQRNIIAPVYDRTTGGHTMITIPTGTQTFDGDLALAFSRSRTGSNDYDRMGRQRCVMTALASQMKPLSFFARFPAVLDTIEKRVTTDMPLSKIPSIVYLAASVDTERVIVVGFDRGYRNGQTANGLAIPNVAKIQAEVQLALNGQVPEGSGLTAASSACGS
jgi:LCP family protein required for cell wall assembly